MVSMDFVESQQVQSYAVPEGTSNGYGQQAGQKYTQTQQPSAPYAHPHGQQVTTVATAIAVSGSRDRPETKEVVAAYIPNLPTYAVVVRQPECQGIVQTLPETYCCLAWISCLCCCCPIGACALISAWRVGETFAAGDFDGAMRASETARKLSILAIVVGLVFNISSIFYNRSISSEGVE